MRVPRLMSFDPGAGGGGTRVEAQLTLERLAEAVGLPPERVLRLVDLGLVEPARPGASEFTAATALRLARILRLRADLGIHLSDAGIILDLIERLDRMHAELVRLQRS